ncbi:MAG: cyclic pyranopterin monophosphate synthase MoaC [Alphaproteobacteria bacterium]|nr:cyclic pyranopterin monophosphate synthase MoaC [Alphaproteobacteria bacterium]
MAEFTHLDEKGNARMVDVGDKEVTERSATAKGRIHVSPETLAAIREGGVAKGDVFSVSRLAGIMGAKKTPELIPLCHPLPLSSVAVELAEAADGASAIDITATCKVTARTGVEMEALTAVAVAALTVYDMCKAADRSMRITDVRLIHKAGGRSGTYRAEEPEAGTDDG